MSQNSLSLKSVTEDIMPSQIAYTKIDATQLLTKVDPYFECCLCHHLVHPSGPLECSRCHVVFCHQCIDEFITARFSSNSTTSKTHSSIDTARRSLLVCPKGCENLEVQPLHHFASQTLR